MSSRRAALAASSLLALAASFLVLTQSGALAQQAALRTSTFDDLSSPDYATPADSSALADSAEPADSTALDGSAGLRGSAPLADAADTDPIVPPAPESGSANYGKPKIWVPGRRKKRKTFADPLPPLVPYRTSAEAKRDAKYKAATDPTDPAYLPPSPTTAMPAPIPAHRKPRVDKDPFAPVGIDLYLLRVKPYAETDIGYNDNPNVAPKGSSRLVGSPFLREEIGASAASDWSVHSFTGAFRLGYDDYFKDHSADAPDGDGNFKTRIDVTRDTKILVDGNFNLSTQLPSSPNLNNGGKPIILEGRPIIAGYGGDLGASHQFNRLELSLRGTFERVYWANAHFSDGSVQNLSQDSYDDYGLVGRASYELKPGLKPFVEGTVDRRIHDSQVDTSGYERDSVGGAISAGSTFELTRLLTGEISAGYADRNYQDPRLANLRGPIFNSSLVWSATPLTKVTLRGATTMDETTIPGSPGAIDRLGGVEISDSVMPDLTLTASASIENWNYINASGSNQTLMQFGLKAEYNLTRCIVIKGSFTHQRMLSAAPGTDYTANIIMVGLRLQR